MFLIPMAGMSSRFFAAGYTLPKYQLPLGESTVFDHVIASFEAYFKDDLFVFAAQDDPQVEAFLHDRLQRCEIDDYRIVRLTEATRGQAETVKIALYAGFPDDELFIFNIDTFRPGFRKAEFHYDVDGYLEVFVGEGDHWSFALPGDNNTVVQTTEKERISSLCSDGLYHFRSSHRFQELVADMIAENDLSRGEYYVAPMYNRLIRAGADIRYQTIPTSDVIFCGTPDEYQACRALPPEQLRAS